MMRGAGCGLVPQEQVRKCNVLFGIANDWDKSDTVEIVC
jgi:hypothetical protein